MKINRNIALILKIYALVLSIFSSFRLLLFFVEKGHLDLSNTHLATILKAFVMGLRFDLVISGYILFLPAVLLLILGFLKSPLGYLKKGIFYWIFLLFTVAFMITAADIPYFMQFYDRFSIGAFEWFDHIDFVFAMIFQETKYLIFVILFFIIDLVFFFLLRYFFKKTKEEVPNTLPNILSNIVVSILLLGLMFIGIRGRLEKKSPIRVGTAYFSDNSFLNKLGLNPVYTLMRSYLDSKNSRNQQLKLMNEEAAIAHVKSYLAIDSNIYNSPIARTIEVDSCSKERPNVVLIIMESMSVAKTGKGGYGQHLTPFLDSLAENSMYFENIYTAGKHTFNGIFSSLFSFPAIYRRHSMKQIDEYNGLSQVLLKKGYSTSYFTTHDSQFDNVEGFLRANGFQNIISQANYPSKEVKTTLGVPDDYMFRHAIPIINQLAATGQPFFTTFMTASDHGPYYIPHYFKAQSEEIKDQIVEYADWSIQQFFSMASKEKWFKNTLFVLVADHGAAIDPKYDIALNYFHSPLIFFAPYLFPEKKIYSQLGSQIDIFPSIMGLLKFPYINNTFGIDLLKEKRQYTLINDDDKIGILDSNYLCIMKNNAQTLELYNYKAKDKRNYFNQKKEKAKEMGTYAKSVLQSYQDMLLKKQTRIHIED